MAGWTAEDLAGRGRWRCVSVVTAAFFARSFFFVRPVVAVCGREREVGGGRGGGKGTCVPSCAPMPPTPMYCNADCSDYFVGTWRILVISLLFF
jgi:hypothetical protein